MKPSPGTTGHPGLRVQPRKVGKPPFEGFLFHHAPQNVYWEVTRACDLVCQHCRADAQVHRHPEELTFEEGKALLRDIATLGSLLIFTGGDPLKRPDLLDLMAYARELRIPFGITPSTTPLLTRSVIEDFKAVGVMALGLSLDGPTPEIHDTFRGFEGAFDRALEVLGWAEEVGLPVQVNTTVTARNIHRIPDMLPLLSRFPRAVRRWSLFVLIPVGRGVALGMPDPEDLDALLDWTDRVRDQAPFHIRTVEAPHYRVRLARTLQTLPDEVRARRLRAIGAGIRDGNGVIFVSHTGDVHPSGFLPVVLGNVRERPLSAIYRESPVLQVLRDPDRFGGRCGRCRYRYLCGGSRARAWGVHGDMLAEDPLCTAFEEDLDGYDGHGGFAAGGDPGTA